MNEVTAPIRFYQTCILENPQVLGYRTRRDTEPVGKGSYTERPLGQQPHNLHPLFHG